MRLLNILFIVFFSLSGISCKKLLDVDPTRLLGEESMWNTQTDAKAAMLGLLGLSKAAFCDNERYWLYGDLRTIDGKGGDFRSTQRLDLKAISQNKLTASYPLIESLRNWRRFYAVVNAANVFLENAPKIIERDPHYLPVDFRIEAAHARFLRALAYFNLVRIWGDVPLILSSNDGQFGNKPRESKEKILAFIEEEIKAIIPDVPVVYKDNNIEPEVPRASWHMGEWQALKKHGAYAILAQVYAWQGKYADAAICAKWVLDNRTLQALTTGGPSQPMNFLSADQVRQMFRGEFGSNQYSILFGFPHNFVNGEASNSGCLETLTLAAPYILRKSLPDIYVPKDTILSVFKEIGDQRFYIDPVTALPNGDRYFGVFDRPIPVFTKVFIIKDSNPPPLNSLTGVGSDGSITLFGSSIVLSRPEDMRLLLAEAYTVLGDTDAAFTLLNDARAARGLPAFNLANGSLIDAIFTERRKEFMGEGHRWYDMVRYKKIKNNDPAFNAMIQDGGIYWPIAKEVISQNPLLVQYPHWSNN
ncbi:MAG: RagB/SusD family nutrient uptake outer membrane protein [Sphingobacteriaceae bacterium]|nr:RagB/SusD family nutrient uptake outer membrane protein [Sphingobacteriaceae bacterium]